MHQIGFPKVRKAIKKASSGPKGMFTMQKVCILIESCLLENFSYFLLFKPFRE